MTASTIEDEDTQELRSFLNSWLIPNDTRTPTETLPALVEDPSAWHEAFAKVPLPDGRQVAGLLVLRDDLRADVAEGSSRRLDGWLEKCPLRVRVVDGELGFSGDGSPQACLLGLATRTVLEGRWKRLRSCPDCKWVFYDQSRNNSRTWCSMYAGSTGRACGSIAKVRRARGRQSA
ncbi:CGNR zinc finger domain-containing protein [Streptomyces sp. AC536]|uniref:CGNR zinc finger domain-containing protein n=1 Tax=Streptomyces buecherae TaxID=2763006 RepID=UPI00164E42DA|nr:CGNR zinc finger domain-containing protein [Streptomyces buecherae]MBC3984310.1 CGNR zinc finger domain-containing protein [Streptomyces buecherae]QNJ38919.1 CGNR zinc finger domain-containing protein [Streptomyces buecherae]